MRSKGWIAVALFLLAALLSAWLSPALSTGWGRAASGAGQVVAAASSGGLQLRSDKARDAQVGSAPAAQAAGPEAIQAVVQAAIYLPLWEEDANVYLPLVRR